MNFLQTGLVAADAKTAKALKLPITVEYGQARYFDRQALIDVIERPKQNDSAEGFPRCECSCDLALWIKIQGLGYLSPIVVKYGGSFRSEQIGKFLACESEASGSIGLPDKTERRIV